MAEQNENLRYIVRLASTNLDGTKPAVYALSNIKGMGYRASEILLKKIGIPLNTKLGEIPEDKMNEIKEYMEKKYGEIFPEWALNHRLDIQTGENLLKVGPEWDVAVQDDINRMKRIRSYKGIRHEKGKKVRGQRTRSNGRKGLAVGVIKKKEQPAKQEDNKKEAKK